MIFKKKKGTRPPRVLERVPPGERFDDTPKVYNGTCKFCKHMEDYNGRTSFCTKSNVVTMMLMGGKYVYTKWERCDLYEPARHCGTCVHSKKKEVIAADKKIQKSYCDAENDIEHARVTAPGKKRETECPMWELRDWKEDE